MKAPSFAYAKPRSLEEAFALLEQHGEEARLLAGGQSLLATLNFRLAAPRILIDINALPDLDGIGYEEGEAGPRLRLGALARHAELEASPLVAEAAPPIAAAMPQVAHPAIRNRGTLGGSLAFADPAAELPACLLALDGAVEVTGRAGRRRIAAEDFFLGLYETALPPGEIITAALLPGARPGRRFGFAELCRRHGDYAMVGLAAAADLEGDSLSAVRLAYFGVGATALRARRAEAALQGEGPLAPRLEAAAAALAQDLDPPGDLQADAATRRHLAAVLLRRVVTEMAGAAA